jgi:hypothetical protein
MASAMPATAMAGTDTAFAYGSGPDGYHSYTVSAGVDFSGFPVQASIDHFIARAGGAEIMNQVGIGLNWSPTELVSASYRRSIVKDDAFRVVGDEIGVALNLDRLWQGRLGTRIEADYGDFEYEPDVRPAVKAAISHLIPDQQRYMVGIDQELTDSLSVYGSHEEYHYTRDPVALAILVLRRARNPATPVFVLVSFPERTSTIGLAWEPIQKLDLDLSYSSTDTVIDQNLENIRLGLRYQVNTMLSLGASATVSRTGTIKSPAGATLIEADRNTYLEFTAGLSFR